MPRPSRSKRDNLRLLAILAHPDDESLGLGGMLARYAGEGVETSLLTATRGQNGRNGESLSRSPETLGALRAAELMAALTRPQVVVTFEPEGAYERPDHTPISQSTAAASVSAAQCRHGALHEGLRDGEGSRRQA